MVELPTITLTFLFTDIEGSTRLWEQHPQAMQVAHARHLEIVSQTVDQHCGFLVHSRGEGDSIFSVFTQASDALAAVCRMQRAFASEPWPAEAPIHVRAALHTGVADRRNDDYNSADVNRCARLRAIAHGGQTLLSGASYEAVRSHLPAGASLEEAGTHRLRDLRQPEHVWQLRHPDLDDDFPPLRSLTPEQTNLPQQLTSFIGRKEETGQIKHLMRTNRLLTLTGAGGSGKTRLAVQAAADLLDDFPDGVWFVEFALLSDPLLMPQTVASVLGVREEGGGRPLVSTLADYLKTKQLLLVLDNCEHLVTACAHLADHLLRACPSLHLLATSREALNVEGERVRRVPSLPSPDPDRLPLTEPSLAAILLEYDAVRLFAERAAFYRPDFDLNRLNRQNMFAVAQVCHRLDGIPLAIELAAARVRAMSVAQIASRLDDRLRLLTDGSRTALPRQQTLRATIDWSYSLLEEPERALLRGLSVFVGGWTLEALEGIYATDAAGLPPLPEYEVINLLSALVDKSLVVCEEHENEPRYRLQESVRQYAREKLAEAGEEQAFRQRHRTWFAGYAQQIAPLLLGPESAHWWGQMEAEYPNFGAALEGCLTDMQGMDVMEAAVRLLWALTPFWIMRGHGNEGRDMYARLVSRAKAAGLGEETAYFLWGAGYFAYHQGNYAPARSLFEEAVHLGRELCNRHDTASALEALGYVDLAQADFAAARANGEAALVLQREEGDITGVAGSLASLGHVARFEGDYDQARSRYEEALRAFRVPSCANPYGEAHMLLNLGHVARKTGNFDQACSWYDQSLTSFVRIGDKGGIAYTLEGHACLAASQGRAAWAARLFGAAESLREAINMPLPPVDRAGYEVPIQAARSVLGEEAFARAWAQGRIMPLDKALAYVPHADAPE